MGSCLHLTTFLLNNPARLSHLTPPGSSLTRLQSSRVDLSPSLLLLNPSINIRINTGAFSIQHSSKASRLAFQIAEMAGRKLTPSLLCYAMLRNELIH